MKVLNTRIPTTFLLAALLIAAPVAQAQDYRAEILANVIDRCYPATIRFKLEVIRQTQQIEVSEAAMLEELKQAEHTEHLIGSLAELVEGRGPEERSRLYDIAYVQCFLSGVGGN